MTIEVNISTMGLNAILPKEAVSALLASKSSLVYPSQEIAQSQPQVIHEEAKPKGLMSKLKTTIIQKRSSKPIVPVHSPIPDLVSFDALLIKTAANTWDVIEDNPLGAGAFGSVKRANYKIVIDNNGIGTILSSDDVVKVLKLPDDAQEKAELIDSTNQEHARLEENGIAICPPIIDEQNLYLLMTNCGVSLDHCMPDRNQFDFDKSFEMAHGILNDMFALQRHDIIHRDLKPANICRKEIKGRNGKIYYQYIFIDFGLSINADAPALDIGGTPHYMAPETLSYQASPASDVYALAGIFLEIFGAKALLFKDMAATVYRVINAPYSSLGIFGKNLPPAQVRIPEDVDQHLLSEIEQLLMHMGDPDPAMRPTIDFIVKFFNGIPYRREITKTFAEETSRLNVKIAVKNSLVDTLFTRLDRLGIPHPIFHYCGFEKTSLQEIDNIVRQELGTHFNATQTVIANGQTVNTIYSGLACNNQPKIDALNADMTNMLAFRSSLDVLTRTYDNLVAQFITYDTFRGTNSSGIKLIKTILAGNDKPILQKLSAISAIANDKIADTHTNNFHRYRCCLFKKKGRHDNIERLYRELAKISIPDVATITPQNLHHCLPEDMLNATNALFEPNTSFTHGAAVLV
jgi:serine/threonine protein kinase